MKITYSAPVRAHHYPFSVELHKRNSLLKFISGFSRLSPRASLPEIGSLLHRVDFYQTIFAALYKFQLLGNFRDFIYLKAMKSLDYAAYDFAIKSDFFIYYRTCGLETTKRIHAEGRNVICITEEVNAHIEVQEKLLSEEYLARSGKPYISEQIDYTRRKQTYENADVVLCASEFVKRSFIQKGFDAEKILKLPYGFTPPRQFTPQKKSDDFIVLYVGQINFRKGLYYLLKAFNKLEHSHKKLIIVGPKVGYSGLDNVSIPKEVEFRGVLKGLELAHTYMTASVFCLPTIEDGFGLVLGEAISYGLPVISTSSSGAPDLFTHGEEGFIITPGNIEELHKYLEILASDKYLLQNMSENARRRAQDFDGWKNNTEKFLIDLEKLKKVI